MSRSDTSFRGLSRSRVDTAHLGQGERCTVLSRPDSRFLVAGMFTEPTSWKAGTQASLSPQHPPAAWTARCPLEKVTMCHWDVWALPLRSCLWPPSLSPRYLGSPATIFCGTREASRG